MSTIKIIHDCIANKALNKYNFTEYDIELISQSANVVYKIVDKVTGKKFSFRIHDSRSSNLEEIWTNKDALNSEMMWLKAISMDTDINVPTPIENKSNGLVTEVSHDNKKYNCTLLAWIEGEEKFPIFKIEDAKKIGTLVGNLHHHASTWKIPEAFKRPVFNEERLSYALKIINEAINKDILPRESDVLIKAGEKSKTIIASLEKGSKNFGVIHADLIPSNLLFNEREAFPIDFGACGFGFYLFDLGWTFSYIHPAFRKALLESYSEKYFLPDNHVDLLEMFFVVAQLDTISFWLGLPDSKDWIVDHIKRLSQREFLSFLEGKSFLFDGIPYWQE